MVYPPNRFRKTVESEPVGYVVTLNIPKDCEIIFSGTLPARDLVGLM